MTTTGRTALTVTTAEARAICAEDPSLVYVDSAEVAAAIGDDAIVQLRSEADDDDMQRLICRLALDRGGDVLTDALQPDDRITDAQRTRLASMTRTEARVECARAIAAARAVRS